MTTKNRYLVRYKYEVEDQALIIAESEEDILEDVVWSKTDCASGSCSNLVIVDKIRQLTQQELLEQLPFGREFEVIIEEGEHIAQHPLQLRPLYPEVDVIRRYSNEYNLKSIEENTIRVLPDITKESFWDYVYDKRSSK